jgi:hypothetical protein
MKATLEFNLPEDEVEYYCATKGTAMLNVIWEIKEELRGLRKYSELEDNQYEIVEKIENFLFSSLEEHDINIDK